MTNNLSLRYYQLVDELRRLRINFLPSEFDKTGSYTEQEYDRARAYVLLAHAEIESYLEDVVADSVSTAYSLMVNDREPTWVMLCLSVAVNLKWDDGTIPFDYNEIDTSKFKVKKNDDSLYSYFEKLKDAFGEVVSNNNGIKRKNLKRLLMPVGIALSDLDDQWINDMDSYGGGRGRFAHNSRIGISEIPDPKTEFDKVSALERGLKELDEKLYSGFS